MVCFLYWLVDHVGTCPYWLVRFRIEHLVALMKRIINDLIDREHKMRSYYINSGKKLRGQCPVCSGSFSRYEIEPEHTLLIWSCGREILQNNARIVVVRTCGTVSKIYTPNDLLRGRKEAHT